MPNQSRMQPFDLFIIGGGINGCGIARDAAGRGLRVMLAEMNDFGGATSSASTKLFHGGLRYLEYFEFNLVRKALIEREVLLRAMPHISWPMRFVLPLHKGMRFDAETPTSRLLVRFMPWLRGRRPAWLIRLGLFLYDTLGGRDILPGTATLDLHRDPVGKPLQEKFAKGFEYLSKGLIDGFASAGNTGAMFVGGYYSAKAIPGILRPAISSLIPREDGGVTVLLDVGANADCKPDVLYQFGVLGSLFSEHVCGIKKPKVSLLNLGEEKTKGNMLSQASYSMMENNPDYNFIGNIEGRDIFDSETDVIVCDGFTGNIVLKEAEGIYSIMERRGLFDEYFKRFNYENYGGTPILGLNKTVIVGHGISNEIAIKNMITLTKDVVEAELTSKIKNHLN